MNKYTYNEYDENPVYRTYKQRKKKKLKKRVKIMGIVLILIMIISYLLSPYSKVKSIHVIGHHKVSEEEILEHISVKQSSYYFLVNRDKVEEEVKTLSDVKKASVKMSWIGDITIEIEEAIPIAYAQIGNLFYEINDIGGVLQVKNQEELQLLKGLPFVQNFKNIDLLKEFAKGFYQVPSLMQNEISEIILEPQKADPYRLKCIMKENKIIYVRIEDIATKLNSEQFNYEAYKTADKDVCSFSIEGRNIYMSPCQ